MDLIEILRNSSSIPDNETRRRQIMNILRDLRIDAYDNCASHIMRSMIDENQFAELSHRCDGSEIAEVLYDKCGYRGDAINRVLSQLFNALNLSYRSPFAQKESDEYAGPVYQQEDGNIRFCGESFNQSIESMAKALSSKGFRLVSNKEREVIMRGTFFNIEDVKVAIRGQFGLSYEVECTLIDGNEKSELLGLMININQQSVYLLDALTEKYGEPIVSENIYDKTVQKNMFDLFEPMQTGAKIKEYKWGTHEWSIILQWWGMSLELKYNDWSIYRIIDKKVKERNRSQI